MNNVTPTDVIRYQDLSCPRGGGPIAGDDKGVENLRYDSDGDGTFETVVNPTIVVGGTAALDVTPPTVSFSESSSRT